MAKMYDVSTDGCNISIMGYPFFAEKVQANEAFRRRDFNYNNFVGGTASVTKGPYVPLEFTVTTHVLVDPNRPDAHNTIFQEMMRNPVDVVSPELGGKFKAIVVIKPEHSYLNYLELSISIKEVPNSVSLAKLGESFKVPASKKIEVKAKTKSKSKTNKSSKSKPINSNEGPLLKAIKTAKSSKRKFVVKKSKSKSKQS